MLKSVDVRPSRFDSRAVPKGKGEDDSFRAIIADWLLVE
jgi:hypothetical protein